MDFLSGLGNIFHSIGNFVTGHGFNNGGGGNPTTVTTTTQSSGPRPAASAPAQLPDFLNPTFLQKATAAPSKPAPAAPPPPPAAPTPAPAIPNFIDAANLAKAPTPQLRAPIVAPSTNIPLETAKQAIGGSAKDILNSFIVAPAKTVGAALNPVPVYKQIHGLLTGNRAESLQGVKEQTEGNPIGQAGSQFSQAAQSGTTGEAAGHIASGVLGTANLIGSALGPSALVKAPLSMLARRGTEVAAAEATTAAADEVAPGVKSANPAQVATASRTAQIEPPGPQTTEPQPAPAAIEPPGQPPVEGQPAPSVQGTQAPIGVSPQTLEKAVVNSSSSENVAQSAHDVNTPAPTTLEPAVAAGAKPVPGTEPPPLQTPEEIAKSTPTSGNPTAPNAPELRAELESQLKATGTKVDNAVANEPNVGVHEVLSNEELNQAANRVISTMPDEELLKTYSTGAKFHNAGDVAQGYAALNRLGGLKNAGSEDAARAIDNILEAAADVTSQGGRTLNYAQSMYENLPRPAKISYLVRNIDKLRDKGGLSLLKDDVATRSAVEQNLDRFLQTSEDLKAKIAEFEGNIQKIASEGGDQRQAANEINKLRAAMDDAKLQYEANDGKAAQYYDSLVPKAPGGERAGDLGRTLMLSSPSGRANDVLTTGINVAHTLASQTGEAIVGKVLNAGRALVGKEPGKYIQKIPSLRTLIQGGRTGLQKSTGEFKGNVYAGDLLKAVKGNAGGKTQLMRAGNGPVAAVKRFIRAGAEVATNASQGIKDVQLERLADQEGRAAGLKGDALAAHTAERVALPTRVMQDSANRLHEEVNNINDNPISSLFGKMADGISHFGGSTDTVSGKAANAFGEQVRNLVVPFTKWAGGQAWNAITDKNAIANARKLVTAALKGDSQEAVSQLAKLATNTTLSMTLGYHLARQGLLTTTNAEGFDDDGLYLHVGGRYIPAATLGFLAPSMILGAATYHGFNDKGSEPVSAKVAATANNIFQVGWRAYLQNTVIGDSGPVQQALNASNQKGSNVTPGDVAATALGGAAGQYIPAVTGDANSVLNNYTGLDPTHEAALTKVTKTNPTTGRQNKDYVGSAVNQLLNKIPGVSQLFPRKAGVAAPDLVDRVSRGDRDTATSVADQATAKTKADQATNDTASGVPDPNKANFTAAIEARVESGKYDQAITGLQQKLTADRANADIPKSTSDKLQSQVTQFKIAKATGLTFDDMKLYNGTTLAQWRAMGEPTSDTYDQNTYDKLWQMDKKLAEGGVAGAFGVDGTGVKASGTQKYSAKSPSKSGSGSKATGGGAGAATQLQKITFGNLAPQKISSATIPTIQTIPASQLIKQRTISVSNVK